MKPLFLLATLLIALCTPALAVQDPAISIAELRTKRAAIQRQIADSAERLKRPDISSTQKASLLGEQQRLQKQDAELKKSIELSEQVLRNEAVTYARE